MNTVDPARHPDRPSAHATAPAPADGPASPAEARSDRWFLSSAPVLRALVHLSVPMAAAMVVSAVYSVVNAGFIGSLHDSALLAAVTLGAPLLAVVMAVGGMFGVGGGALVSRLLGAAEQDPTSAAQVKHVSSFALWGAVGTGVALGAAGLALIDPLVGLLGADAAASGPTRAFVGVLLAFAPVFTAAFCLEQLVRAEGAARQVMIGLVVSTVTNVVLDVAMILVLHLGVAGAALATGLANVVLVAYLAVWLHRHSEHTSLAPRWFTLSPAVLRPVLGVGVSELFQASFLVVTALVLNNLAATYGDTALAAMGVAVRVAQVPEFLVMGITLGVLPLFAYAYGKGDRDRLRSALRVSALTVGAVVLVTATVGLVLREPLVSAFTADRAVLAVGVTVLTAQLVAMVVNGFTGLLTSYFQATGRTVPAIVMSSAQGVLFVPTVVAGHLWFGLAGIIWALTVSEVAVLLVGLALWLGYRRSIDRGLAEGSAERADAALDQVG